MSDPPLQSASPVPLPNQVSPVPPAEPTQRQTSALVILLIILVLLLTGTLAFLVYQNAQLRQTLLSPTPSPTLPFPSPSPDPTASWQTYTANEYTFKYPKGLKLDTEAAGKGYESIRVQYMGPKQLASGRTEVSFFDGYSFTVTKISSNTAKSARQQMQEERSGAEKNCFDQSIISPIIQTQISGISAYQYIVTQCLGDYTTSYLTNNDSLYRIIQLYVGDDPEKQNYKSITNQILSTFKFLDNTGSLPPKWTTKTSSLCNVSLPLPPKEVPYYHPYDPNAPPSVTDDIGSGRYWQFGEDSNGWFSFQNRVRLIYMADYGASGYIAGIVEVMCFPNASGSNTDQLLSSFVSSIESSIETTDRVTIGSLTNSTAWTQPVKVITFKDGVFDPDQRYYLFATPKTNYLITQIVNSNTSTVKEAVDIIFNGIRFL